MKFAMSFLGVLIVVALLLLVAQPRISAHPTSIVEIENYVEKKVNQNKPPGISIAVVKNGQIVYNKAFGWADSPAQLPAAPDTVYHWWSMTKVSTAIAILQLHDAKTLNIDDPVSNYLPFFQVDLDGKPAPPITIRQVLRHTSGLPDTIPTMIGWVHYEDKIYNQTELLKQHLPQYNQLKFAPDSKVAYSNLGYMILGTIIETVSGKSYEEYVQDHILAPLEMSNTSFLYNHEKAEKIAAGSHPMASIYTPMLPFLLDMDKLVNKREGTLYWFNPMYLDVTPSSGLIGSTDDAITLAQALLSNDGILSTASHSLLLPAGSKPTERPLGWA
ncbi:MAG TPA: serine hydrolase domain-containing protein, partial [Anaerolineales bacterium]|nr:serine hydrolase domain-containing protein [Anaerolineales bacterium]